MAQNTTPLLLLAGCGKMGNALLAGWIKHGLPPATIRIVEPDTKRAVYLSKKYNVTIYRTVKDIPTDFMPTVVILAVKPQAIDMVISFYAKYKKNAVFLSIVAGKNINIFEKLLGKDTSIIRSMPNIPAVIQHGITALYANSNVTDKQKTLCESLLSAVGETIWITDENLMDAVTAVSGSGPAYVFLLSECLAIAGQETGLPKEIAYKLARATVIGSGKLLHQSNKSPTQLRIDVTSPGGTTAAALNVLMGSVGLSSLICEAVEAAVKHSKTLALSNDE